MAVLTEKDGHADHERQEGASVGGLAAEFTVAGGEDGNHQQERAQDFTTKGIASLLE